MMLELVSVGVQASLPLGFAVGGAFIAHGSPLNRKAIEGMKSVGLPPALTAAGAPTEFVGSLGSR